LEFPVRAGKVEVKCEKSFAGYVGKVNEGWGIV